MRSLLLASLALVVAAPPLAAQRVLAPTLDATTLERGVLRTTIETENILLRGRWADGSAQPLGAGLSVPLDPRTSVAMRGIGDLLSDLGRPDVVPSLGTTQTSLRQRLAVTRLGLEYGLSDRLGLRVQAPFVRVRAEASMTLADGSASAGLNPTLQGSGVAAANRAVVDAYAAAAAALVQRRDDCAGNPAAHPECGTINAELAAVNAAIARGNQFATALTTIYGAQGLDAGLRYVPMENSLPEVALRGIGLALQQDFERWGVTNVDDNTGFPLGAQTQITADELRGLLTAPFAAGLATQPLRRSTRQDLGDVDVSLRFKLFDGVPPDSAAASAAGRRIAMRSTLALTYRLGQGNFDLPDNLIDLGTGSGHDALALHAITDVVLNARVWATATVGWARGAEHERLVRVPLVEGVDLIGADREVPVRITPADMLELRLAPRWSLNDYLGLGGEWRYRTRGRDRVVAFEDPAIQLPLGAGLPYGDGAMQTPSDSDEHRWAWTLSYSTLGSHTRGNARLPFELFYTHEQSVGSSRGIVPRRWEDRIQFRFYTRLFGR